jgi:type I restriction enzyme S subunit
MKVTLTTVCNFQGGTQPSKNEWINHEAIGYVRMLQIRDFTHSEKDNIEYVKDTKNLKKCNENDILIGRYGASVGKILTGLSGAYNVAIVKAIPDTEKIYTRYLYYFFTSPYFQNFIKGVGSRAAQAGFNKDDLKNAVIPLVSLDEQRKIASMLDKVSDLIAKRRQQLDKLDEMVKARFVEMFGAEQRQTTVSDICTIITDGTHQPPKFIPAGIPFLFVSNIVSNQITYETEKYISEETYHDLIKRTPIELGDILLSTVGSYGHPAIVKEDKKFLFQRHIAYLKPNHKMILSEYLHSALLSYDVQRQIEEKVKGVAQKTLNLSEIRKIRLPIPSMDSQYHFCQFVEQTEKTKNTISHSLEKLETLKKALMQEYFE